jgi:hypothetical protein
MNIIYIFLIAVNEHDTHGINQLLHNNIQININLVDSLIRICLTKN